MTVDERKSAADGLTNKDPTEAQKKIGNYKKGSFIHNGLKITIENPAGSIRRGTDISGNDWEIELPYSYGYFNGTLGKDGDQVDVFINNTIPNDFSIFLVDQVSPETRAFDEHKVMYGFLDKEEAKAAYMDSYESGWLGFGNITEMSLSDFKEWLSSDLRRKYPASKFNYVKNMGVKNSIEENSDIKIVRMFGEVVGDKTLNNLKEQAGDLDGVETLVLEIASPGGSVAEGLEIMVWLDWLSSQGIHVITVVVANAYSIASLIMLSANTRLISKHGKVMVHNPMLPELQYVNANDLEKYIEDLRNLESVMYDLYQIFTRLDKDIIKELMDRETYLSPQEAVEYGFADSVVDIKPKSYEMTVNNQKKINMSKTLNVLNRVIALVGGGEFVNQTYSTESSGDIEIYQKDPAKISVGDRTSIEEGEVKIADGSLVKIEDFVVTDINKDTPAETPEKETDEVLDADFNEGSAPEPEKKAEDVPAAPVVPENEDQKKDTPAKVVEKTESTVTTKETVAAQISHISKWESEVVNDTFEVGTKVEYAPHEDGGDPVSVGVGEWELEDGRKVLTDSDGVIQYIKEAPAAQAPEIEDPAAKVDDTMAKDVEKPEAKMSEEMKAAIKKEIAAEYENKISTLEKEMKELKTDFANKFEEVSKFEKVAAKAIDSIAENTMSRFKPEAKISAEATQGGGSIFQNLKRKAGLDT